MVRPGARAIMKRARELAESSEQQQALPQAHQEVEDTHMQDMIEDLYPRVRNPESNKRDSGYHLEKDELTYAVETPLYDGSTFSVLRTSLELLNLQSTYGWSYTSVDDLLK